MSEKKQEEIKPITEPNAYYERVLELREKNPKTFAVLSPAVKMALYHYEAGRREHFRLEALKTEKGATETERGTRCKKQNK